MARKDLSKKKTVSIRFHIGFERMIRAAILQFREMGLEPVISRGARRTWVAGASANKQYDYDHRNDEALYLNEDLVKRRLRAMQVKYDEYKELADGYAGPAVVETFGEVPFEPVNKKQALHLNERQQKLRVGFQNEAGQIVNRYIKDDEYGYTIIAYPMPEIDPRYEKIFREIVKINTLDYEKYQRIQQYLIDALDEGVSVHVLGKGENRTDLRVMLHHLNDPAKETNFENCVADCNIPVGEVFTSPSLTGTTGVLHVTGVYLNELYYRDLCLTLTDGMITAYDCANFEKEDPYTGEREAGKSGIGAGIGSLVGAGVGALSSSKHDRGKGALIGAAAGAALGGGIGYYMDVQEAKLRDKMQGTGVSVTRNGDNIVLNMPNNVTFDSNSANLKPAGANTLTGVAMVLKEYEKTAVNVVGYTDRRRRSR